MLIDTHSHLFFKEFKNDLPEVLERARQADVTTMINVGTDLLSSREAITMAYQFPNLYAAVGVHPHDVARMGEDDLGLIRELAQDEKVVGIGEVGLDYYYEHSPREVQQAALRKFVRLSLELGLPIILHCRDAFDDCFRILDEEGGWQGRGVFHCFTGDWAVASRIVEKRFYISFSGIVTFKKSHSLHEVARSVPADLFFLETDCPFLAPEPFRGKRNEPSFVGKTAESVAQLRGISLEEMARQTTQNAQHLFALS